MAYKGPLDYIDVATRITEFRTQHPGGSLTRIAPNGELVPIEYRTFGGKDWVVYTAFAYRDPGDRWPGVGTAWEPVPGATNFTRDSEVQNAETAAWGRAMVAALAVDTRKGVASSEEVRNRQEPAAPKPIDQKPERLPAGLYDLAALTTPGAVKDVGTRARKAGHLRLLVGVPDAQGTISEVPFGDYLVDLLARLEQETGGA